MKSRKDIRSSPEFSWGRWWEPNDELIMSYKGKEGRRDGADSCNKPSPCRYKPFMEQEHTHIHVPEQAHTHTHKGKQNKKQGRRQKPMPGWSRIA